MCGRPAVRRAVRRERTASLGPISAAPGSECTSLATVRGLACDCDRAGSAWAPNQPVLCRAVGARLIGFGRPGYQTLKKSKDPPQYRSLTPSNCYQAAALLLKIKPSCHGDAVVKGPTEPTIRPNSKSGGINVVRTFFGGRYV